MEYQLFKKTIQFKKKHQTIKTTTISKCKKKCINQNQGFIYISSLALLTVLTAAGLFAFSIIGSYNKKNELNKFCYSYTQKYLSEINHITQKIISLNKLAVATQVKKIALYSKLAAATATGTIAYAAKIKIQLLKLNQKEQKLKTLQQSLLQGAELYIRSIPQLLTSSMRSVDATAVRIKKISMKLKAESLQPTSLKKYSRDYSDHNDSPRIFVNWTQQMTNYMHKKFNSIFVGMTDSFNDSCATYLTKQEGAWTISLLVDKY